MFIRALLSAKEDVKELKVITLSANSLLCNASSVSCVNNSLWMFDNKFVVLLWNACKFETFDLRA